MYSHGVSRIFPICLEEEVRSIMIGSTGMNDDHCPGDKGCVLLDMDDTTAIRCCCFFFLGEISNSKSGTLGISVVHGRLVGTLRQIC